ncbi:MAG TPA: hypothetical protein VHS97_20185 [Isosphaeraceae bacterium]|nr:hypothetical protein [Isosphaeraceae bacterium]
MGRQRSLEHALDRRRYRALILGPCACILLVAALPGQAREDSPAVPHASAAEPIERRPYRISLHMAIDPSARIDLLKRADLIREWQILVRRFIGAPWIVSIADPPYPLANLELDSLGPDAFASVGSFDKVWVVRVTRSDRDSVLVFTGREYDTSTRQLGPLQVRRVSALSDAPRAMLQFARDLFNPTAAITGQEGGRAILTVQGASIAPASPIGAVVAKGMVFQPLRLVSRNDGKVQVLKIIWTYLQAESVDGAVARCAIISGLRDPLSKRYSRPNSLVALGLKSGNSPLKLRFVSGPDQTPAAGYTLTARLAPDGQSRELGTTDRAGRIVLKPGFARSLVIMRLLAGSVEPIAEFPMMPGESGEERVISVDPKPHTVALESQLDSLRDEVVDLVALRARLEARMKARLEGEDWTGLEEALKEFARLTPRDKFAQQLTQLKDDAAHRQAELKTAVLTKTAQAQITELQSMIDRYMEDDAFRAYSDAVSKFRSETAAKAKAVAKKAATAALVRPSEAIKKEQPAPASPSVPAPGAPKTKQAPPLKPSETPF